MTSSRTSDPAPGGRRPTLLSIVQAVAALALVVAPLVLLLLHTAADRLTANPIQEIERQTGKAAYLFLLLSLTVTPVFRLTQWARLAPEAWAPSTFSPLRRVLGWGALGWGVAHFLVFVGLDYGFDPSLLWGAIAEKRFALVGLAALVLLVARAVLPLIGRRRRVGRLGPVVAALAPLAAALVTVHYLWAVKTITTKEIGYAVLAGVVLVSWLLSRLSGGRGDASRTS